MAFPDMHDRAGSGSQFGAYGGPVQYPQAAAPQAQGGQQPSAGMPSAQGSRQKAGEGAFGKMAPQQAAQQAVYQNQSGGPPGAVHSPEGWDFSGAGVAQQYFDQNAGRYQAQGAGGQWWDQNQGQFQGPGQAESYFDQAMQDKQAQQPGTNYAQQAYQDFAQGSSPNLDPYYANAKRKLGEDLNQQFASRGAYGSSVALDRLAEGYTDLNAAQANREGDYALQRYGLGGQLGTGADSGTRANSQNDLSWTTGLGGLSQGAQGAQSNRLGQAGQLAMNADQTDINRLNSGMNAAATAEEARRQRGQDYFNNLSGSYASLAGMGQHNYDALFQDDAASLDAQLAMQTGLGAEYLSQAQRKEDQKRQDDGQALGLLGMFVG